jgi:WD40 repeat protein
MKWNLVVGLFLSWFSASQSNSIPGWHLVRILELKGPTHHVQGIDFDAHTAWASSVDSQSRKGFLQTFSFDSGALLQTVEVQDGDRFHPGGIAVDGESLWMPVAEYRANSTSTIQKRDKKTLKVTFQFPVADHIGCIAVTPKYLVGGNWDSRDFYLWDYNGKLIQKITSSTNTAYQDMKFDAPYVVASGPQGSGTSAIDWLELPSLHLIKRITAGNTDRQVPLSREGMAIHKGQLVFLPEDDPSRLIVFRQE